MKKIIKPTLVIIGTLLFMTIIYNIGEACGYRAHLINTRLDDMVPYLNYFIYFYIAWYPLLFIIPIVIYFYDKDAFLKFNTAIIISLFVTLIIFVLYPTIMTRYELPLNGFSDHLVQFIYSISSPTKCVPSLHVIYAFMFILPVFKNKKIPKWFRIFTYIFAIGITLSTIFIKQHLIYDVVSAIAIVVIAWLIVKKYNLEKYLTKLLKL